MVTGLHRVQEEFAKPGRHHGCQRSKASPGSGRKINSCYGNGPVGHLALANIVESPDNLPGSRVTQLHLSSAGGFEPDLYGAEFEGAFASTGGKPDLIVRDLQRSKTETRSDFRSVLDYPVSERFCFDDRQLLEGELSFAAWKRKDSWYDANHLLPLDQVVDCVVHRRSRPEGEEISCGEDRVPVEFLDEVPDSGRGRHGGAPAAGVPDS